MELYQIGEKLCRLAKHYELSCNACHVGRDCMSTKRLACYIVKDKYGINIDSRIFELYESSLYKTICLKYTYRNQ